MVRTSLKTTDFTLTQAVTSYLFIPYEVRESGSYYPILYVGWTLTYEMFFYAVFAVSICFVEQRSRVAITAFFVLLATLSLTRPTAYIFRFLTDPLLLEFIFGCVFAWAFRSGFRVSRAGLVRHHCRGCVGVLRRDAFLRHGAQGRMRGNSRGAAGIGGNPQGSRRRLEGQ
ncbi:hypothetical protein ACTMU2_37305 [Cupriavidus basilensis]